MRLALAEKVFLFDVAVPFNRVRQSAIEGLSRSADRLLHILTPMALLLVPPQLTCCHRQDSTAVVLDPALNSDVGKFSTAHLRVASEARVRDYSEPIAIVWNRV